MTYEIIAAVGGLVGGGILGTMWAGRKYAGYPVETLILKEVGDTQPKPVYTRSRYRSIQIKGSLTSDIYETPEGWLLPVYSSKNRISDFFICHLVQSLDSSIFPVIMEREGGPGILGKTLKEVQARAMDLRIKAKKAAVDRHVNRAAILARDLESSREILAAIEKIPQGQGTAQDLKDLKRAIRKISKLEGDLKKARQAADQAAEDLAAWEIPEDPDEENTITGPTVGELVDINTGKKEPVMDELTQVINNDAGRPSEIQFYSEHYSLTFNIEEGKKLKPVLDDSLKTVFMDLWQKKAEKYRWADKMQRYAPLMAMGIVFIGLVLNYAADIKLYKVISEGIPYEITIEVKEYVADGVSRIIGGSSPEPTPTPPPRR